MSSLYTELNVPLLAENGIFLALNNTVQNFITNPSSETNTVGYGLWGGGSGGTAALTRETSGGAVQTSFARGTWTVAAPATGGTYYYQQMPFIAGSSYSFSGYMRTSATGKSFNIGVEWRDASQQTIGSRINGSVVAVVANTWTRLSIANLVAPANAVWGLITFYANPLATAMTVGETHDIDGIMVTETTIVLPYFDGDTIAGGGSTYAWNGTTHASTSTKTTL